MNSLHTAYIAIITGFLSGITVAEAMATMGPIATASTPIRGSQTDKNRDFYEPITQSALLVSSLLMGRGKTQITQLQQRKMLPTFVERSVRRDAARRSGQPLSQFQVSEYKAEIWPDGCLGLGAAEEICSQSLVSGWWVVVSETAAAGDRTWFYRSNASGRQIRLDATKEIESLEPER